MRDDFIEKTKDTLSKRVGTHCSNPKCWKLTSGPRTNPAKAVNIGVAAHITAASDKGPRFDATLTARQRSSISNAIWLCQNCAKLIDNDPVRYTVEVLRQWKTLAEETALIGVSSTRAVFGLHEVSDEDLVKAYAQCFDRPAFQDHFRQEGSMEAFDKAIEDTIIGINTGAIRARDGQILMQTRGKVYLKDLRIRERMDVIVDLLRWIRFRYADGVKRKAITFHGKEKGETTYCINEQELAHWMDSTRTQILQLFSEVCHSMGIQPPSLRPGQRQEYPALPVKKSDTPSSGPTANLNKVYQDQVADLVHELRSPLGAIRDAATLLQATDDPNKKDQLAGEIVSFCKLVHYMLTNSWFFAHSNPRYTFQRCLLLRDIIQPVIGSIEIILREHDGNVSHIHVTDFSAVPPLWLDRSSLQQVFFIILANAVKHTLPSKPPRILIRATQTQTHYELSVCDWGIGIDKRERDDLFLPRFRGSRSKTMDVHGTGMGLAIARMIVEAHGGKIGFQSLHDPTEIVVSLPRFLGKQAPPDEPT